MAEHAGDIAIRNWRPEDAPALLQAATSDPELARQLRNMETLDEANALIAEWTNAIANGSAIVWAIVLDDAPVGTIGITNIERRHLTGWCWYWLTAEARGRGVASRALATAAQHAFDAGVFRLELGHRVNNPASGAVARRAGFLSEGIQRQKLAYDGERFDCETHARLATDPAPAVELLPLAAGRSSAEPCD